MTRHSLRSILQNSLPEATIAAKITIARLNLLDLTVQLVGSVFVDGVSFHKKNQHIVNFLSRSKIMKSAPIPEIDRDALQMALITNTFAFQRWEVTGVDDSFGRWGRCVKFHMAFPRSVAALATDRHFGEWHFVISAGLWFIGGNTPRMTTNTTVQYAACELWTILWAKSW